MFADGSASTALVGLGSGSDAVFGGSGAATVVGGTEAIGFKSGTNQIPLQGYSTGEAAPATSITLSDNTRITFLGNASLPTNLFG